MSSENNDGLFNNYTLRFEGTSMFVDGIIGASENNRIVNIPGPEAEELSHLSLHYADLEFAKKALVELEFLPPTLSTHIEALWRVSVFQYIKCFGNNTSRFSLDSKTVYKGIPKARNAFDYFYNLRNKYFAHDGNNFATGIPCVVLGENGKENSIVDIITISAFAGTNEQANRTNLMMLIDIAMEWVKSSFNNQLNYLRRKLENLSPEELREFADATYTVPMADDVGKDVGKSKKVKIAKNNSSGPNR